MRTEPYQHEPPLEVLASETLRRVQDAFIGVVEAVPGPTDRPHEIQKALGLHKTLAWKLSKIVASADPIAIHPKIPGAGAVEKVLASAAKAGVGTDRLDRVRAALADLDALVAAHAGRRETFDIMLSRLSPDHQADTERGYRKDGFRATSHIWGVQARTVLRSVIAWPSREAPMLDAAVIFGCVDFVRLRADRPWTISRWRPTDDAGVPVPVIRESIDPVAEGSAPLLVDFCSEGPPDVRRLLREDRTVEDELMPGPIGTAGALTYFSGEVVRGVMSRYRGEANQIMAQNLELRTPCRTVVFDHLVHRDLFGRVQPKARMFGELAGRPLYSTLRSNRDQLDLFEDVRFLGSHAGAVRTADVPRYEAMVRHVCDRLGWDPEALDVYRLRVEFPYVPATITYDYPLPESPA